MAATKSDIDFKEVSEKIKNKLSETGSSQRWLCNKLGDLRIDMTDTKLSNRLNLVIDFTTEEIEGISKVLSIELI